MSWNKKWILFLLELKIIPIKMEELLFVILLALFASVVLQIVIFILVGPENYLNVITGV